MGWWVACSPCSRAARARRAFGSGTFREFRVFLFGAFWLDPGEGCENMLRAATENTRREAQRTARRTRAKHQEAPRSQRCECGGSRAALARALRALAGRLELERFVSFSSVF